MNLAMLAPEWLMWTLVVLLSAAAVEDIVRLRISNLTVVAVIAAAVAAMVLVGPRAALWQNGVVLLGLLAVGTPLFAAGKMGGGDVKLLAAAGLWFDLKGALTMLIAVLLAGGLLAFVILVVRLFSWSDAARDRIMLLRKRGGIPYGLAIAAGALLVIALARRDAAPGSVGDLPLFPSL